MIPSTARLSRPLGTLLRGALDAVLPQTCIICGEWIMSGSGMACGSCDEQLTDTIKPTYCPHCGRTMPRPAIGDRDCARCKRESFWNVAGVARVGAYTPPIQKLTLGLKYAGRERNADFAADLLASAIERRGWLGEFDFLVPVPMHWLRRWQRPCDHADLLAAALARRLKIPLLRAVKRIKHTPSQVGVTSRAERFRNVERCFACRRWMNGRLAGARVCIVDNLLATGATVHEVSKVLRRAGARRIHAAVIARTVLAGDTQASPGVYRLGTSPLNET